VFNLMEDAATAEISRSQIWQWIRSTKGVLDDGRKVTVEMFRKLLSEELVKVKREMSEGRYDEAAELFAQITADDTYVEFLTLPAYELLDLNRKQEQVLGLELGDHGGVVRRALEPARRPVDGAG
jgi:malate synthase